VSGVGRRHLRRVLAAIVIGCSVALVVPETAHALPKPRVDVIGDSITYTANSEILTTLKKQFKVYVSGRPGTWMAQNFTTIAHAPPAGDWVIELGTNDVGDDNANWASDFATEVSLVGNEQCVALVTVGTRLPGNDAVARGLDAAMAAVVSAQHNFHLVPWGTIEYKNPRWLLPDHVHPTASGAQKLADLEWAALQNCQ